MKWSILKFTINNKVAFKLYRGYYGGYLSGDGWLLNSGISSIESDFVEGVPVYVVHGESGSVYVVPVANEGMTSYMLAVLHHWKMNIEETNSIEISSVKEFMEAQ